MPEPSPNVTSFRGAHWTVGTKDGDKVYWEVWNAEQTIKIADGTLDPASAHRLGQAFVDKALAQGWTPEADQP